MAQNGTLLVRTYVSAAQIPVAGATVVVSKPDGAGRHTLLAIRSTDESGVAAPIALEAPELSGSLTPDASGPAFSDYTLVVEHPGYQLALFDQLQVFPGVETVQDVPLIPLSPNERNENGLVTVTPQPL